jgi:pimeloyl-ACP methyl ester carboxylesterase
MSTERKAAMTISVNLRTRSVQATAIVDGGTVSYWDYPPSDPRPESRTIVAIHGFRGDHHGLERVVEALPTHRIIMPDLPGFGASPAFTSVPHDVASYARFVHGFLAALNLGPETVLLGHSFGSLVCSQFVAAHPQAVYPLVLVNPIAAPALQGPKAVLSKLAETYYVASARLPEALGQALLRNPVIVRLMSITMAKTRDKDLRRFIHGQHAAYFSSFSNRDMLLEAFRASIAGTVRQVAAQLTLPVLLIAGDQDEIAPLPSQHALLELLPSAELVVIPGVGHLIHYETPAPAAQAIDSFLSRHPVPQHRTGEEGTAP